MIALLRHLEPRCEPKGTVLYEELEEITEIFFVSNGTMDIGYEINKQRKYVLRYTNRTMVGAYNCTFNKRTMFLYRCRSECKGYFIRKINWLECIKMDSEIENYIKKNVQNEYFDNILQKVMVAKKIHIEKLASRKDFEQVKMVALKDSQGNPKAMYSAATIRAVQHFNYLKKIQEKERFKTLMEHDELVHKFTGTISKMIKAREKDVADKVELNY